MAKISRKTFFYFSILFFSLFLVLGEVYSQPMPREEKDPEIKLGAVTFLVREFESTPSPIKMLEIHIEIFNNSRRTPALPGSINVIVIPKEIKYPESASGSEFSPPQEEAALNVPLPPNTGRVLIIGVQLPEKRPESITFEIQVNPPDGEKKTVEWQGGGS
jgi:hypothetical protein